MKTRFLFRNYKYQGSDKEEILSRVVHENFIDILILAESSTDQATTLVSLGSSGRSYNVMPVPHNWIQIFAGYPRECFLDWVRDEERLCLRKLKVPGAVDILLAGVHLASGLHSERAERKDKAAPLARAIRQAQEESDPKHSRTIVGGDFNLNPFDDGMVFPEGFGAMMTRSLVRRVGTTPSHGPWRFYNPMWSKLGVEIEDGSPGTFYWPATRPQNIYWNYYDQVLVGSDLMDHFRSDAFDILTSIPDDGGRRDLVREAEVHWKVDVSDHLPIVFEVDIPEEAGHA